MIYECFAEKRAHVQLIESIGEKQNIFFLLTQWLHANANGDHIADDFGMPIDKASCQNKSNNEETFYQTSTIRQ